MPALAEISQARLIAGRLTAAGRPVSRRALRGEGVKGSNQALSSSAAELRVILGLSPAARQAVIDLIIALAAAR